MSNITGMPLSEVCIITRDLEKSLTFYVEVMGLTLDYRMPGFADFSGEGVRLALWSLDHLAETTGVSPTPGTPGHTMMIAINFGSPEEIDQQYEILRARGVQFVRPPQDYPWNARCVYFPGPDGELWELYAWFDGGEPGKV